MSSSSVTTSADGTVTVTSDDGDETSTVVTPPTPPLPPTAPLTLAHLHRGLLHIGPDGAYVHSGKPLDRGSFFAGLTVALLVYLAVRVMRRLGRRREARGAARAAAIGPQADARDHEGMAAAVAALARRTATLETIVTDPAHRTAREIDALR